MNGPDWEPVADLCSRLAGSLPELARDSVEGIRRDLEAYSVVPVEEHLAAVTEQHGRRLEALAEGRMLDAADLERAGHLARRRARQGIPVDVLIGAYHVGDQELWRALCRAPGPAAALLPEVASLMFESLHAISTVLATAHGEVTRALQGHRVTLSQRLVELLTSDDLGAEALRVADALGLDPEADFVAGLWQRGDGEVVLPAEVQRRIDSEPATLVNSYHSGCVVILAQGVEDEWLERLALRLPFDGSVGIGLRRTGLAGAAVSLGDARLALSAAEGGRPVRRFADSWGEACLAVEEDRLEPVLRDVRATARAHPHLAEAVLAFADADMSVAGAGERLHLHPNSVTYRLQRWGRLTGWDPRTFDGLARGVTACRLALREGPR